VRRTHHPASPHGVARYRVLVALRCATLSMTVAAAAAFSLPCAALNVSVTATDSNAVESGQRPPAIAGTLNLSAPNLALRDALSVLNANRARAGSNIDSLNIVLSAGVYRLTSPLVMTPDPSWNGTPITLSGAPGARVIISGARVVTGFAPVRDPATLARLPALSRAHVLVADLARNGITDLGTFQRHGFSIPVTPAPLELFYRDQPMTLARWPSSGFATIASLPDGPSGRSFTIAGAHLRAWQQEPDLHAMGYWARDWADATVPVESVDPSSGRITLAAPTPPFGLKAGQRVFIENALSELGQPGEYYVDRQARRVYFWPPAPLQDGDVEVSMTNALLATSGASNLTITNLTFDVARGDGLIFTGGGNIVVDHAILRNMAGRAAVSSARASGFRFTTVENTGEGGLVVYSGNRLTLSLGNSFVEDSTLRNYARRTRAYRPAISVAGVGDRLVRNTIYDGPHAAIIFAGNDHLIAGNEIYNVVTETADAGAIYTGRDWTARGTVIEDNFIHDIGTRAQPQATVGVYLDDEACGITVQRNIFSHVNQSVFIGGGRDNLVEDNLFVNSSPAIHVDSRGLSWQRPLVDAPNGVFRTQLAAVRYDQPPYSTRYPALARILYDMPGAPLDNVLRRNVVIDGDPLSVDSGAAQYVSVDAMFSAADVVFAKSMQNASRLALSDLAIAPTSPAVQQGFRQSLFTRPAP
jgi:Right handed beta helix region